MNRQTITKHVAKELNTNIPLIDGAKTLEEIKDLVEQYFEQGKEVVALANVLPPNKEYTSLNWCGENYQYALTAPHPVKVWEPDFGVAFIYSEFVDSSSVSTKYKNVEDLKNKLNVTSNPLDLIIRNVEIVDFSEAEAFTSDVDNCSVENDPLDSDNSDEPDSYQEMNDSDLRAAYKKKFGKNPGGRTKRETIIKKLSE